MTSMQKFCSKTRCSSWLRSGSKWLRRGKIEPAELHAAPWCIPQRRAYRIASRRSFSRQGSRYAGGDRDVDVNSALQRAPCDRTICGTAIRFHIAAQRQTSGLETCAGFTADPVRAGGNCDAQEPRTQSDGSTLHQDRARRFKAVGDGQAIMNTFVVRLRCSARCKCPLL